MQWRQLPHRSRVLVGVDANDGVAKRNAIVDNTSQHTPIPLRGPTAGDDEPIPLRGPTAGDDPGKPALVQIPLLTCRMSVATLYSDSQALAGDALNKIIDQFSDVNAQNSFLLEKAFTGRPQMWKRYLLHILSFLRVFGIRKEALCSVALWNKPSSAHCVRSRVPMSIWSRRCSIRRIACTQSLCFLRLCSQMPDPPHCLHLPVSFTVVLADTRHAACLTRASCAVVLADASSAALLAAASFAVFTVLADSCVQLEPPHC